MGEIYEALEDTLDRRVALKIIAPNAVSPKEHADLLPMFLNEARTLAQVNHPNIVAIHGIYAAAQNPFIAMEYVEGVSFKDLFSAFSFSAAEMAPFFLQMLEGVTQLHERGILHRDLKPHNLMLRVDGQIKILDFGIAKRARDFSNTLPGLPVGTLAYMAPEVIHGAPADHRSDLWSLGAIFYEAVVGAQLVSLYSQRVAGVRASAESDLIFPHECLNRVPAPIRTFIGRICDKSPEFRYSSAAHAARDLRLLMKQLEPQPDGFAKHIVSKAEEFSNQTAAKSRCSKRSVLRAAVPSRPMKPALKDGSSWVPATIIGTGLGLALAWSVGQVPLPLQKKSPVLSGELKAAGVKPASRAKSPTMKSGKKLRRPAGSPYGRKGR
jgi:serine/threonine-protein kinase